MVHFTFMQENMAPPHYENPHRNSMRILTDKPTLSSKRLTLESPRVHPYHRPQVVLSGKMDESAENPYSSAPHDAAPRRMVRSQSLRSVDLEVLSEATSLDVFQPLPSPVEDATYSFQTDASHAHLSDSSALALSDLLMSSSDKMDKVDQNITFRPSFFMPPKTFDHGIGQGKGSLDTFGSPPVYSTGASTESKQDFNTNDSLYLAMSTVPFSRATSLNVDVPPSLRAVNSNLDHPATDDISLLPPLMDLDSPYTSPWTSPVVSPISSAPNSPTPEEYDTPHPQLKSPPSFYRSLQHAEFKGLVLPPSLSSQREEKKISMMNSYGTATKNKSIAKRATGLTIKSKKSGPRYRSRSDAVLTRKFVIPPSLVEDPILDSEVSIGEYTRAERRAKLIKFKEKKKRGIEIGFVRYKCRKNFADKRPRVGGRFVKLNK